MCKWHALYVRELLNFYAERAFFEVTGLLVDDLLTGR